MKLNKKNIELINLIERCGFMYRNKINKQKYPDSMINALIEKGLLAEHKNKITSTTQVVYEKAEEAYL